MTRAAQIMDAEVHVVAWSGRGVVWNNSTEADEMMPALMERALPADHADGCSVVTLEGLDDAERSLYAQAFSAAAPFTEGLPRRS